MRGIRVVVDITAKARDLGLRYNVKLSDGHPGRTVCLADPEDQYATSMWTPLLGTPVVCDNWATDSSEGMYVTIERQWPNPEFDFSPEAYQRQEWLRALWCVTEFRLYNPWIGKPFMSWNVRGRWSNDRTFYEGESVQFDYTINDYELKLNETARYQVRRCDDSNNYKEFVITLGV